MLNGRLAAHRGLGLLLWAGCNQPIDGDATSRLQHQPVAKSTTGNQPPDLSSVWIEPAVLTRDAPAHCAHVASDPDGDPLTVTATWTVNGGDVTGTDLELSEDTFVRYDEVVCHLEVSDGIDSVVQSSAPSVVANAPPRIESISILPDPLVSGDVPEVVYTAVDADDDAVTVQEVWRIDGVETTADLDALELRGGQTLEVELTPDDGLESGPVAIASLVVANTPPTMATTMISPEIVHADSTLWCIGRDIADPDEPLADLLRLKTYFVNGVEVGSGQSVEAVKARGDEVHCEVEVIDAAGASVRQTSPPVQVINRAPTAPLVALTPVRPADGDALQCRLQAPSTDADGDPISYTIGWEVDHVPFTDTTTTVFPGDTVPAGYYSSAASWRCVITPHDGITEGNPGAASRLKKLGGNILLLLLDDVGVDKIAGYGEHPAPPPTPNLDRLIDEGILFRNAYASPICSATRANVLTGRYGRRNGIGEALHPVRDLPYQLPLEEIIIPEVLDQSPRSYSHALVGKWHLVHYDMPDAATHPLDSGFDWFQGHLSNVSDPMFDDGLGGNDYARWEKNDNGILGYVERYATIDTVDDALAWIHSTPEPWFLEVAFQASHLPFHVPPPPMHSSASLDPYSDKPDKYDAMTEALDTAIGRLLSDMGPGIANRTHVVVMSDNGSTPEVIRAPWDPTRGKHTLYEGGTNVPLIYRGPLVTTPGAEVNAFVHAVDLLPTFAEIVGVETGRVLDDSGAPVLLDGHSLVPWLLDPDRPSERRYMFTERVAYCASPGGWSQSDVRAIRDDRYKIIRTRDAGDQFFEFVPGAIDEGPDLLALGPLSPEHETAYADLSQALQGFTRRITWAY